MYAISSWKLTKNIDFARKLFRVNLLRFCSLIRMESDFLVSSKSHAIKEERELDDLVYSNDVYADTEMQPGSSNQFGLRFISGIINKFKALRFERKLFRATKGNMLFNQAPTDEQILDPVSTEVHLVQFAILYPKI
ncbi:hypothetical protein CsSME_00025684 [Camellia sinensis var. sinensis]